MSILSGLLLLEALAVAIGTGVAGALAYLLWKVWTVRDYFRRD